MSTVTDTDAPSPPAFEALSETDRIASLTNFVRMIGGIAAALAFDSRAETNAAADKVSPRRVSRFSSCARPRDSLLRTVPKRTLDLDRPRLTDQNQEDCLKGILDVISVMQKLAADVQDHRPMPYHQPFKGRVVTAVDESFEDLLVRQARERSIVKYAGNLSQGRVCASVHHES